jgi:hypothetical protein
MNSRKYSIEDDDYTICGIYDNYIISMNKFIIRTNQITSEMPHLVARLHHSHYH